MQLFHKLRTVWFLASALVLPMFWVTAVAAEGEPIVTVPVIATANGPVTVLSRSVTVLPGEKSYLFHSPMSARVYSWGSGSPTNIGLTFAIKCYNAAGSKVVDGHYGVNIIPTDTEVRPVTRVLLDQPLGGTFTCNLTAAAYSTQWAPDMQVGIYAVEGFPPELGATTYANASTWTSIAPNDAPGFSIAPGSTLTYLTQQFDVPRTAASWEVVADGQISTCKSRTHYVPVCEQANNKTFSTVQTWIEFRPLQADAVTPCAPAFISDVRTATITDARHHQTMNNSKLLTSAQLNDPALFPAACPKVGVALKAKVTHGDYAIAHDAYNFAHAVSLINP